MAKSCCPVSGKYQYSTQIFIYIYILYFYCSKYYGDWNPLLGLLYLKLAKIQHHESYLKECIDNFHEARKILEITHGKDHSLIQNQLKPLLLQALAENSA